MIRIPPFLLCFFIISIFSFNLIAQEESDLEIESDLRFMFDSNSDLINEDVQILYADTLFSIVNQLIGTWEFMGYYENGAYRNDTLHISSIGDTTNYKIQTDSGLVNIIVVNQMIYDITKEKSFTAIEFSRGNGFVLGYIQYDNYSSSNEWEFFAFHQPIPKVVIYNGEFYLLFTGLGWDSLEKIKFLNKSRLIIAKSHEVDAVYSKLKTNN